LGGARRGRAGARAGAVASENLRSAEQHRRIDAGEITDREDDDDDADPEPAGSAADRETAPTPLPAAVLPLLLLRLDALLDALDGPAEAIFVDDGSRDTGPIVLEAKARSDTRYR